ncbi:MAG TPA: type III-B CRISPR module RAMP protein Cmr6 [Chloroflexota bacterium]|nr:type III-B CRISPR module RAMP protein Cmr6 [Chloroflexota bacterium]
MARGPHPRSPRPPQPRGGRSSGPDRDTPADSYPLPRRTRDLLAKYKAGLPEGANASLLLNKLAGPWKHLQKGEIGDAERKHFLERCIQACKSAAAERVRAELYQRWRAMLASYRDAGWTVHEHTARPAWRFVSGLGLAHSLEVNLVLHRIGGFPYIPGSSIKGAVRAYAEWKLGQPPRPPDTAAKDLAPQLVAVFGARDQRGKVIFFDALPASQSQLELDVINVHYPEYYRSGSDRTAPVSPPTEWQNPNPVLFLAVGRETRFAFAVAAREAELAARALAWLQGALQTTGLGGKTRAGYGLFV